LPEAKARAKRAHAAARAGDAVSAALYDRIYATALTSAAATMFARTAICLEVLAIYAGGTQARWLASRRGPLFDPP
jgi:hypothetical protein